MPIENFETLLEENLSHLTMSIGSITQAEILHISDSGYVTVSAGLKSEAEIPVVEFQNAQGELEIEVGDLVDVAIETVENGFGETCLSREKAIRTAVWGVLETAHTENSTITGKISGRVKGGFTVELGGVMAFLPGSLIDIRPVKDLESLEQQSLEFKIVKIDKKRNNVVVSRRAVIEADTSVERNQLLSTLEEGMEIKGIIKNLTDYGAFVDLGGIDGLLHITDMSWKRLKHPSDIVNVGDEVTVRILSFDREKQRVSLGLKQLRGDPWEKIASRYPNQARVFGHVTNVTEYGCFVEIEEGIEGLVHMSEMDWTNKNIHPNNVVQVGDELEVMVLEIDEKRRRISLGLKQCTPNPWQQFALNHEVGEIIAGNIRSITDFGIFIGLESNIDGLIHRTDISWTESGEKAIRLFKRGDEIKPMILSIDSERERISLGLKQIISDPFEEFLVNHPVGSAVEATITDIDPKQLLVKLDQDLPGILRNPEAVDSYTLNETHTFYVESYDHKGRSIQLSLASSKPSSSKQPSTKKPPAIEEPPTNTILADMLKAKLDQSKDKPE